MSGCMLLMMMARVQLIKHCSLISWQPPMESWVKVNVDGSRDGKVESISTGEIIKSDNKNWVLGFTLNKWTGSVIEAELWSTFKGLRLAWEAGFRKVVIECDSKRAIDLLRKEITLIILCLTLLIAVFC
ncbi:hypothetical protein ACOSQ3_010676 [Xanthoceras sorbifolium]